jgi:serine/threonine protein kinase
LDSLKKNENIAANIFKLWNHLLPDLNRKRGMDSDSIEWLGKRTRQFLTKEYGLRALTSENYDNIWWSMSNSYLDELLLQGIVPLFSEDFEDEDIYKFPPETKSLMEMLSFLRKNGIHFQDLNEDNLMIGNDGNFKIIDVGMYELYQ